MTDAYLAQVVHQLDQARRELRTAEDELAMWRQRGRREGRLTTAWQSARQRAIRQLSIVDGYRAEAIAVPHAADARITAVRALHYPEGAWWGGLQCYLCRGDYPCATIQALDGVTVPDIQMDKNGPDNAIPQVSVPAQVDNTAVTLDACICTDTHAGLELCANCPGRATTP